uniref:2-oxoacid:acceptor oxidoreductase subunit alpha n=1 Tax=candidate division WOR-3 bacterium TaxID=2052148 RepID=A0A7C4C9U9_UNCW3
MAGIDFGLIVTGQAGQGLQVIAQALAGVFVRSGYHVFVSQDVMSRIRGGHNFTRVRIATKPVGADADRAQMLVALDAKLASLHLSELADDGLVLIDPDDGSRPETGHEIVAVPLRRLAREHGREVMTNSVALGAALALLQHDPEALRRPIQELFAGKGQAVADENLACARAGFDFVCAEGRTCRERIPRIAEDAGRLFLTGAQALGLGAIAAGVRLVAGYPMSPATPIFEFCARNAAEAGIAVELVEDEIAAINMALGAAFAGARAMTCTAGGGFCLMNEGLSLAGMTETPVVIMVGMRPGPATGLATRTAQADLLFCLSAGHGEFPRAVLAPADPEQAFHATIRAFRIAEEFQTPVIVLFDQFMADATRTIGNLQLPIANLQSAERQSLPEGAYRRYEASESGVSPFLRPGTKGQLVYVDSDEHNEEGHITESAEVRVRMVEKRARKAGGIAVMLEPPEVWPGPGRKTMVVGFGSTRGAVLEAVERLRGKGLDVGVLHICDIWPFPIDSVRAALEDSRRVITVENNWSGQVARLLRQEAGITAAGSVRRFDGRQFAVAEVAAGIERLAEGKTG